MSPPISPKVTENTKYPYPGPSENTPTFQFQFLSFLVSFQGPAKVIVWWSFSGFLESVPQGAPGWSQGPLFASSNVKTQLSGHPPRSILVKSVVEMYHINCRFYLVCLFVRSFVRLCCLLVFRFLVFWGVSRLMCFSCVQVHVYLFVITLLSNN